MLYFQALLNIAKGIKKGHQANTVLYSENHALAITIRHKAHGYVVKFYDPNKTTVHKREICSTLEAIKTLSIDDFLEKNYIALYFSRYKVGVLAVGGASTSNDKRIIRMTSQNLGAKLYFSLTLGLSSNIERIVHQIMTNSSLSLPEKWVLLKAKEHRGHFSLYTAFQNNHLEAIDAFTTCILDPKLSLPNKLKLLHVDEDGVPGLHMALQNGHCLLVETFTNRILGSSLSPSDKITILQAQREEDGVPGLYMALQNGHSETIIAFVKCILNSELSVPNKLVLLRIKGEDGVPWFCRTALSGYTGKEAPKLLLQLQKICKKAHNTKSQGNPTFFSSKVNEQSQGDKTHSQPLQQQNVRPK